MLKIFKNILNRYFSKHRFLKLAGCHISLLILAFNSYPDSSLGKVVPLLFIHRIDRKGFKNKLLILGSFLFIALYREKKTVRGLQPIHLGWTKDDPRLTKGERGGGGGYFSLRIFLCHPKTTLSR